MNLGTFNISEKYLQIQKYHQILCPNCLYCSRSHSDSPKLKINVSFKMAGYLKKKKQKLIK